MASIPRDTDINPLSQIYDELRTILSGLVVKFSIKADKYETLENRQYSDTYIAAINKTDSFGLYEYTKSEYIEAGVFDEELIKKYQNGEIEIPKALQNKLLLIRRETVIKTYDEPNDYYRILNGLPPKGLAGASIVTSIMNKSLLVVEDDDYELINDYTSMRISKTSAYNIMGNNLFDVGNHIYISNAVIQNEKSSFSRSFLIVGNDDTIDISVKSVYLKDVQSILYSIPETESIPGDEIIGKYFHVNIGDTLDTTYYFTNSFIVVEDTVDNYDSNEMIKLSEALLNNKNVVVGDNILLSGYYYVTSDVGSVYGISNKVPIHCIGSYYGERFVTILESNGYLDKLIKDHPNDEYLNHIGSKRIPILKARSAKNFDILYIPSCTRDVIQWVFSVSYSAARDYMVNTVYNFYYRSVYDYYDNFIGLAIVQLAVSQTMARSMQTAIDRDFYDETMVRLLFEMYGVPYYPSLPYQTQRRLVKNLNYLIQNKATTRVIMDIASILGYHDVNVYKYYLVKEREFDSDENLMYFDTTTVEPTIDSEGRLVDKEVIINDLKNMYDVYFQKVDIEETNFQVALTDESKRVDFESITLEDPLWWDDADTFAEVYGDYTKHTAETESEVTHIHYNYRETKYLGMSISYKMSEVLYENILLLRMLLDKKDETTDVFVTLPKITGTMNISLFEIVVFLCALISKQYHLRGEILTRYSSIMDVMGYITEDVDGYRPCDTLAFNFELLTNAETYKEIVNNPSRFLRPEEKDQFFKYLSVLTLNQATTKEKITAINDMYQNIKGLGYFLGRKMSEAENLFEYRAWRDFYNALFIGHENAEIFMMGNTGKPAETYLEYLSLMNPALYNAIVEASDDIIYTYIDHTISRLEKIVHDLHTLYTVNDSNSSLLNYLIKLIKFFKSYTTDLIDVTTEYIFDMRPDNLFKLVEYYKIYMSIVPKDSFPLMYSDTMKIIETTKEIDPLKYKEWIRQYQDVILKDVSSVNNVDCSKCKNFGHCRNFCHNNKSSCSGTYNEGDGEKECRYYGYDSKEFLDYINHYRDLLLSTDANENECVACAIRDHLKKVYFAYSMIDSYNPYTDELKFSPERLVTLIFESLDKVNEILTDKGFDLVISSTGVEGIREWIELLSVKGSDVKRICKNKTYPCRDHTCYLRDMKDKVIFNETLYHDDYMLYIVEADFYSTLWLDCCKLFRSDEINKIIQTVPLTDDSKIKLNDGIDLIKVLDFDERTINYIDTLAEITETEEHSETFTLREELIMYEES